MKGEILMGKIYGYSLTVSTRGKCAERLEEQKKAIKEIYPDAEIIEEVMGLEKFNRKKFNEIIMKEINHPIQEAIDSVSIQHNIIIISEIFKSIKRIN